MSSMMKRLTRGALPLLLIAGVLTPIQAHAIAPFLQREATQWGYVFAGPNTTVKQTPRTKSAYVEPKSKFIVNYKNFPDWAKKDLQAAVNVWAANFQSKVPITIDATWSRGTRSDVLGSARPSDYFAGFEGAPDSSLWYPSALANALAGKDLDSTKTEMVIEVNSLANWNQRNDGLSHPNEYDLESVFIHEMGHGLGFLSTDSYYFVRTLINGQYQDVAYGDLDQPTIFDAYVQVEDGRRLSDLPTPTPELGAALTSRLVWSGELGKKANNDVPPLLYSPKVYEDGSSVSHLDEATFSKAGLDSVMTPNLDAGEIFHEPGPLLLAMMEDLRRKPPAGIGVGIPTSPRNVSALVGDGAVVVTFDPPANARTSQFTSFSVKNVRTGQVISATSSANQVRFTGLRNGIPYTFSVTAANSNGSSEPVITDPVTPMESWKRFTVDNKSDGSLVASTTFNRQPVVAYIDSLSGNLKLATWNGKAWVRTTVDGAGGTGGRTSSHIKGALSLCVNGLKTSQTLHIFYSDVNDSDLRYAKYDGKKFTYEVVDGNASSLNSYEDPIRTRSNADVSVSSACLASAAGVQVFYRDESQGILLGAVKPTNARSWNYELVDGDRKTDGRTTGDVAFHLKAAFDGKKFYLLYDSVLTINQKKQVTAGEVRVAIRSNLSADSWSYQTLDSPTGGFSVAGYDVAIAKTLRGVFATWLTSAPNTIPNANKIRWSYIQDQPSSDSATVANFGKPSQFLSTDGSSIAFNCEKRLCILDTAKGKISLAGESEDPDGVSSTWVVINRVKYLVAGIKGELSMLRP